MLRTALAFAFVGMMLMIPVQVGYATAYTATTTSSGNTISADYFTVGLYNFNESQKTFSSTNNLLKSVQNMNIELKRLQNDEFQIFGSPVLTPNTRLVHPSMKRMPQALRYHTRITVERMKYRGSRLQSLPAKCMRTAVETFTMKL